MDNKSEVARLRAAIEAEYQSAQQAISGFANVGKHEYITARMENMGKLHAELQQIDEGADQFLVDTMEGNSELAQAWADLQSVPSYFERFRRQSS
jgi:hypothetical protein